LAMGKFRGYKVNNTDEGERLLSIKKQKRLGYSFAPT
jgi:hypothetical protein